MQARLNLLEAMAQPPTIPNGNVEMNQSINQPIFETPSPAREHLCAQRCTNHNVEHARGVGCKLGRCRLGLNLWFHPTHMLCYCGP